MKGITLHQPWASCVALGAKGYETRGWRTSHRGWLAIHAAQRFTQRQRDLCEEEPFCSALQDGGYERTWRDGKRDGYYIPLWDTLPLGAVIAVVNLHKVGRIVDWADGSGRGVRGQELPVSATEIAFGDWTLGRFAWDLTRAHRLPEPIPCRGALGLWTLPPAVLTEIERQAVMTGGDHG